jgi:hypothetical protein
VLDTALALRAERSLPIAEPSHHPARASIL